MHDIKPKLTGLKQDEHEIPWGNGVYNQPWVICTDLQMIFCDECDLILSQINPLSVYDDDKTPPMISITYNGGNYLANIGFWDVNIQDLESGLDEVLIEIDDIVYLHAQNIGGSFTLEYNDILVPFAIGIHKIFVKAVNNDKDYEWDQEIGTETEWVVIREDTTAPFIKIIYQGESTDEIPGVWNVNAYDDESGINEGTLQILIDGQFAGNYLGDYPVPNNPKEHSIYVEVENNDPVNPLLNSTSKSILIFDDDDTPPNIAYTYTGDGTDGIPGKIIVSASDNVGLSVDPSGIYQVSNNIGTHNFLFCATDNDNDRASDSLTTTVVILIEIVDDDTKAPIISITYSGSGFDGAAGAFDWSITDSDDGIGGDNDIGLSQISVLGTYESSVGLPYEEYALSPTEIGAWNLPSFPGTYKLDITVFDNDDDRTLEGDALPASLMQEQTIIDDDITAPTILIQYIGEGNVLNPGVWHVEVEDQESGLDEVEFLINNVQCEYHQTLGGLNFKEYDISVPDLGGEYILTVIAKNNDNDWNGDQEQRIETAWVEIFADYTPPSIEIFHVLMYGKAGVWDLIIEDYESGIEEVLITIDNNMYSHYENIGDLIEDPTYIYYPNITVPQTTGSHIIVVEAENYAHLTTIQSQIVDIRPDLFVSNEDISFSNVNPYQGEILDITATISNIGTFEAHNIRVDFYNGDPNNGGLPIGTSIVNLLNYGASANAVIQWFVEAVTNHIYVVIDPENQINELIETNNIAFNTIVTEVLPIEEPADETAPVISISHIGEGNMDDPGYWVITIEDSQSELARVVILINGVEYMDNSSIGGNTFYHEVPVPQVEDTHTIEVTAYNSGGLSSTESDSLMVLPGGESPPGPIIIG